MKKIRFVEAYQNGVIVYPDAAEKFSNITPSGGFVYADYSGYLPLEEVARLPTDPAPAWIIEVPAYLRRFDSLCATPKQAALACDPNPVCQGLMDLALSRVREGIDLKSASLQGMLQMLVSIGKITQSEADCIRTTEPKQEELFRG